MKQAEYTHYGRCFDCNVLTGLNEGTLMCERHDYKPKYLALKQQLKESVQIIDNLSASHDMATDDRAASEVDYYNERHWREKLEIENLHMRKQLAEADAVIRYIADNTSLFTRHGKRAREYLSSLNDKKEEK